MSICLVSTSAKSQSFPIVPLTDPTYPTTDPAFEGFDSTDLDYGTLQRLGDLNNDGFDDIIVVFLDGFNLGHVIANKGFWIFPGNEQGGFDQPQPLNISLTNASQIEIFDFVIHDHNQDGLNDIVISSISILQVVPLLNTNGVFVDAPSIQLSLGQDSRLMYTDVDRDGDDDLIVYGAEIYNFRLDLFTSDGQGNYALAHTQVIDFPDTEFRRQQQLSLAVSDFELDGDLDILISSGDDEVLIENTPQGYLTAVPWEINATNVSTGRSLNTLADVNADGLVDLVVPTDNGFGFFLAPFTNGETREIPFFQLPEFKNDRSDQFFQIENDRLRPLHSPGDLDGDGTDDLILRPFALLDTAWRITDPLNHNGRFGISNELHIHGDGALNGEDPYLDGGFNFQEIYLDINNDGALDRIIPTIVRDYVDLDLDLTTEDHQGVMLWAALANPFMPDTVLNEQDSIYHRTDVFHLTHADLDYDGEPEIILTRDTAIKTVRRNLDDFWAYDRHPGNTNFRDYLAGFRSIVVQLDSDPRSELLSLTNLHEGVIPAIFLNVDVPNFGEFYLPDSLNDSTDFNQMLDDIDVEFRSANTTFAVGDLDNDGDNEIVIRGIVSTIDGPNGESVLVWLNDGEANFTLGPISSIEPYNNTTNINMIELLDHDHDGDLELISIEGPANSSPIIAIYENDGQGNFTPSIQIPIHDYAIYPMNHYWIEINDLDLDGYDDVQLLMEKRYDNQSEVVILYGSPTGISTDPVYLAGRGAGEVHCADLDANGLPDLYTCNYQSSDLFKNSLTIMFQTSPRVFRPAISIHDNNFAAVDALDMNRDGALDLIAGGTDSNDLRVIYSLPAPCIADFNLDTILDFFDISLFIRMLVEQRPIADLSQDGRFDFFDISIFLANFQSGCP